MNKVTYSSVKIARCPCCRCIASQVLYDYKIKAYKCTKCNNIHV
jgi:hypothetical protein